MSEMNSAGTFCSTSKDAYCSRETCTYLISLAHRRRDLSDCIWKREQARTGQLYSWPTCRQSVSAATATSAMSSASTNGSWISPTGSATSPLKIWSRKNPSSKF